MSEWIEHDGKDMPVPGDTRVIVRFRDGEQEDEGDDSPASYWHFNEIFTVGSNWVWCGEPHNSNIVAYRIVS